MESNPISQMNADHVTAALKKTPHLQLVPDAKTKKVLVVVDMQNDFVTKGGKLALPHDTTPLINKMYSFISDFCDEGGKVIYTLDTHSDNSREFNMFPKHCVSGTWGARLNSAINQAMEERNGRMLWKHSFSSRVVVDYLYETHPLQEFVFVGVCTHICVHDIITETVNYFKNRANRIPKITIIKDLVDDFDPEMAEFALKRLQNLYGVKVEECSSYFSKAEESGTPSV